jgi:hypothetical protein
LVGLVAGLSVACGSEGSDGGEGGSGDGAGGPGSTGSSAKSSYTCCINDTNYTCPNKAAFDKCAGGFDIDACMQACEIGDFACQDECFMQLDDASPDPSDCNEDPEAQCSPSGPTSGPTSSSSTGGGNCSEPPAACELDNDCCSGNCTGNQCRTNDVGEPCELDDDCDSGNCTNGECHGNGPGSACELDDDCSSSNCADGVCQ